MELIATLNYVGTHSYILPILDLPAYAIHGGAQGSIYFNYNDHYPLGVGVHYFQTNPFVIEWDMNSMN